MTVTTREISWRELVEEADDQDRHVNSLYPFVYKFSNGKMRRDSGPNSGVYAGDS